MPVHTVFITLLTKVHTVKAMVFPVVMYGCESWTIKKAESWRIDAFELWCWRRLLRVPLDCKEIKPVNPKENQPWIFTGRSDAKADAPIQLRVTPFLILSQSVVSSKVLWLLDLHTGFSPAIPPPNLILLNKSLNAVYSESLRCLHQIHLPWVILKDLGV